MSFTTRSTFSTKYGFLGSAQPLSYGAQPIRTAASVYAGAEGSGSRISVSCSTSFWDGLGSGGLATGMGGGLAGKGGGIQNEKKTMQSLNYCLAFLMDRVRSVETKNWRLENKIWEYLENNGPQVRGWGHCFKTCDLRAQIFANTVDNSCIVLQIDNAHLPVDDLRTELAMCQSVQSNIHGLCKVIDDTDVTRLQLETEIEAFKEELLFMKKHEEKVKSLQAQIASSGLTVEVDVPKSQDLSKIMADNQAQYDELSQKNREELDKYWSQQIEKSTTVVTAQSSKIRAAEMTFTGLRCTVQSLEIDLDSMRNLRVSLKNSLREVEARYTMQLDRVLLHLEVVLASQAEGQYQAQEYEIATYHGLLDDGEDFNLGDALDNSNFMQTIQKITTCKTVDSKVVSEINDMKVLRH
uniref:IF rod domain-containing protein n=1 Tax=Chlorocebus sabaeus TaxID=60711 RepID=A0A0D9RJM3_CHLSB